VSAVGDPLAEPDARCFLSTAGLHHLAASGRTIAADVTTVLHDLIPIEQPHLTDRSHARNFARDVAWMFRNCRQIVGVSRHTARQARIHAERLGIVRVPHLGVAQLGSFLKASLGERTLTPVASLTGRRFALYCSTIEIRKNHILLLKLWSALLPELGDRLPKLVFCGRWGWMYGEVKDYLAAHPELAPHLEILTDMSDRQLAWLYSAADFGLYPSVAEGWGLGAVESLDFGLPMIVSDAPSLAEATQDLMPVLPAGDLDAWIAEVRRAVLDPSWGEHLRQRIRDDYRPIGEEMFAARLLRVVAAGSASRPKPRLQEGGRRPEGATAPNPAMQQARNVAA